MSVPATRGANQVYAPTSGILIGWIGLAMAVVTAVAVFVDERSLVSVQVALGSLIFAVLAWCFLLRPRVVIGPTEIELRNAFSSWHVPLADIRRASVRAVLRITTDERSFDGVAVGRPVRSLRRGRPVKTSHRVGIPGLGGAVIDEPDPHAHPRKGEALNPDAMADLVTEQILLAADTARSVGSAPTGHRRSWAVPELALLALLVIGLVVSLVL